MAKVVTTMQTTDYTRQFVKHFEKLRYNHDAFTVYSDFLAMSAIAISNSVNFSEEREKEYLRIINKYNETERAMFPKMLACIVLEMQPAEGEVPRYYDVLGELFGGLELHDAWKGQFFTPQPVSDFMALVAIGEHEPQIEKRGYITMNEPAIGGGSNVIGAVNAMFQKGHNPCKQLLVTGYDLDPRCVHMSYIQLSLIGVPAMLQQRNSLTLETYSEYWYTPAFVIDDWAGRLRLESLFKIMLGLFDETDTKPPKEKAAEPVKTVAPPKENKPVQLSLF